MSKRFLGGLLATLAVVYAVPAGAADEPDELMPGKVALVKTGRLAKFVAKGLFDLPDAANDPTIEGATLRIFDTTAGGAGSNVYSLPAIGWKALGNPPGSRGYKYKGAKTVGDPCRSVLVKEKVIKAVCKGDGMTLTTPFAGNIGVVLEVGTDTKRYCAEFGGEEKKNDSRKTKYKDAPAPAACPEAACETCFNVDSQAPTDDDDIFDGVCADEFGNCSLLAAVQQANYDFGPDEIVLPAGTYSVENYVGLGGCPFGDFFLQVTDDLTITGDDAATTIIDGDATCGVVSVDNDGFFFTSLDLSNVTLRNGFRDGIDSVLIGAGLRVGYDASAAVRDASIIDNEGIGTGTGWMQGAGIGVDYDASLTLERVTVQANVAVEGGGLQINSGAYVTITESSILDNGAIGNGNTDSLGGCGASGGGLQIYGDANVSIVDSTIDNNVANRGGGDGCGGAMLIDDAGLGTPNVTIERSTISNNRAPQTGAIQNENSILTITNSTITGNAPIAPGGGFGVSGISTIAIGADALTTLNHVTIVDNNDPLFKGALRAEDQDDPPAAFEARYRIKNSLIINNGTECGSFGPNVHFESLDNNVGPNSGCGINEPNDLRIAGGAGLFSTLDDNGGPTLTKALLPGNPAIDHIPLAECTDDNGFSIGQDQRGIVRGTSGAPGGSCDAGAFEVSP